MVDKVACFVIPMMLVLTLAQAKTGLTWWWVHAFSTDELALTLVDAGSCTLTHTAHGT